MVLAALLWRSTPYRLLNLVIDGRLDTFSSIGLIEELARTLAYPKFAQQIATYGHTAIELIERYARVAELVAPSPLPQPISRDPDDDLVIATALAARADLIVSGDADLLVLGQHRGIHIVTPTQALALAQLE